MIFNLLIVQGSSVLTDVGAKGNHSWGQIMVYSIIALIVILYLFRDKK